MAFCPSIQSRFNERVRTVHATFSFVTEIIARAAYTDLVRLTMYTLLSTRSTGSHQGIASLPSTLRHWAIRLLIRRSQGLESTVAFNERYQHVRYQYYGINLFTVQLTVQIRIPVK